jgi:hypothetical protein
MAGNFWELKICAVLSLLLSMLIKQTPLVVFFKQANTPESDELDRAVNLSSSF